MQNSIWLSAAINGKKIIRSLATTSIINNINGKKDSAGADCFGVYIFILNDFGNCNFRGQFKSHTYIQATKGN